MTLAIVVFLYLSCADHLHFRSADIPCERDRFHRSGEIYEPCVATALRDGALADAYAKAFAFARRVGP